MLPVLWYCLIASLKLSGSSLGKFFFAFGSFFIAAGAGLGASGGGAALAATGAATGLGAAAGAAAGAAWATLACTVAGTAGAASPLRKRDWKFASKLVSGWSVRARAIKTSSLSMLFGSVTQTSTGQTA